MVAITGFPKLSSFSSRGFYLFKCKGLKFIILSNNLKNVISLINVNQFLKSQTVLESSLTELSNSHLTSSNPKGFDREIKGFVKNIF